MKSTFLHSVVFGALLIVSQMSYAKTIEVNINGVDASRTGQIMVMLFGQDGFPTNHEKAIKTLYLPPDLTIHKVSFSVPNSEFAIKVLHDEDNSGKTSKNWTGIIPSEGLGFSNGVTISWRGAPKFKDAKLSLATLTNSIDITIRYP
ncbi:DUF2141 domain-containing protein [Pseudoalteromonas luteoviolacea]|uniref:DUF2141 domain-containing protein n=1 Tax=Pseudoalteromonas luteoviolacea NCIMB 1942 TaxID=1365253 RepID=A0A166ZCI7_9GAMM|nr:DUF2141 domain-containing protein [Pseudoalteromonas luteoviolacea]KZN44169.1 hypothetical protein N482_17370 [Pseudoalteromonas luteoviolacea NCIMB 1942]